MPARSTTPIVAVLLCLVSLSSCTIVIPTPSSPAPSTTAVVTPVPVEGQTGVTDTVEFTASKVEDMVGIWESQFAGQVAYMQYNEDGTFRVVHKLEDLELGFMMVSGNIWFEDTVLHTEDKNGHAISEVTVIREGETPVELAFVEIDDPISNRSKDLTAGMKWIAPSLGALKADAEASTD